MTVLPPVLRASLCAAALVRATASQASVRYSLMDLGAPGFSGIGDSINNAGQGTGYAEIGDQNTMRAFRSSQGELFDLGLGTSSGRGINDSGHIVGSFSTGNHYQAYSMSPSGTLTNIGAAAGAAWSGAEDINNAGQVVGHASAGGPAPLQAFLYSSGTVKNLGALGGTFSMAFGLNEAGQVTGYAEDVDGRSFAFLYSQGVMTGLGGLGGSNSVGEEINDAGQIVGHSYLAGDSIRHAFLYSNGVMTDLGTLGGPNSESRAKDINNAGQVTGWFTVPGNEYHGFVYSDGVMTDLNNLLDPLTGAGWEVNEGNGINEQGQIIGVATKDGVYRPVILTPMPAVPEPSVYVLLVAGLSLVGALARRR